VAFLQVFRFVTEHYNITNSPSAPSGFPNQKCTPVGAEFAAAVYRPATGRDEMGSGGKGMQVEKRPKWRIDLGLL
jgi:hypothetical protein